MFDGGWEEVDGPENEQKTVPKRNGPFEAGRVRVFADFHIVAETASENDRCNKPDELEEERHHVQVGPAVLAKNDLFVIGVQSLGKIAENEGIKEIEETRPEYEENEHSHHGDVHGVELVGVEDRHHENAELANQSTDDADNGKPWLFVGNVRLQFLLCSQDILHHQGSHKENELESRARNK